MNAAVASTAAASAIMSPCFSLASAFYLLLLRIMGSTLLPSVLIIMNAAFAATAAASAIISPCFSLASAFYLLLLLLLRIMGSTLLPSV